MHGAEDVVVADLDLTLVHLMAVVLQGAIVEVEVVMLGSWMHAVVVRKVIRLGLGMILDSCIAVVVEGVVV